MQQPHDDFLTPSGHYKVLPKENVEAYIYLEYNYNAITFIRCGKKGNIYFSTL